MKIKDLIKQLQDLDAMNYTTQKSVEYESEIMIDVFERDGEGFKYCGISSEIRIEQSADGVFDILSGFTVGGK
jgi:hypothetical protein